MAYHETYLRLNKAAWGIVIGYKGEIIVADKERFDPDFEQLSDSVFLKLSLELNLFMLGRLKY